MILTIIVGAASAYGISWAIGRAIADPKITTTWIVGIGLVIGNILGILRAKGKI